MRLIAILVILLIPCKVVAADGPRCIAEDNECLLRSLLYQARVNETLRLRVEHLEKAEKAAEQWADQEAAQKTHYQKEAENCPSRLLWFILGAAASAAAILEIAVAAH